MLRGRLREDQLEEEETQPAAPIEVTEDAVTQALEQLRESAAELVPGPEGQPKQKRLPELNDEFAKDVGFGTLEQLREHLRAKLREQQQAAERRAREEALCDELLRRHTFEVPQRLVGGQAERLLQEFQARLLLTGMAESQVEEQLQRYQEQLRGNAVRHVKLAFILSRIAEREGLSVTQDELVERLWKLAKRWGKDPAEVRRILDAKGLWPSVLSSVRQDKTLAFLLNAAHVQEAPSSPVTGHS